MLDLVARHGGFDLTVRAKGDLDVDQHHTVEDVGIALGEGGVAGARQRAAASIARVTFVMPMDETLAVAAIDLGGRPHTVVDTKVTVPAGGRSADRARARFLRGLCDWRARQRAHQGALRTIEPSQDRSVLQSVRASAARRVREGSPAREDAAEHEGAAVIALARLRRRQSDVGAQGVRGAGRRDRRRRRSPSRSRRGARRSWSPGSGTSSATAAIDEPWRAAIRARDRGRRSLFRHLPRPAVALRRQRRGAGGRRLGIFHWQCASEFARPKVPHVGWNSLALSRPAPLTANIPDESQVYFTHSYAAPVVEATAAVTDVRRRVFCGRGAAAILPASSSIRKSPATSGCASYGTGSMLSKRIIACLDVRDGKVVKGVNFEGLRDAGDPGAARRALRSRGHRRNRDSRCHCDPRSAPGTRADDSGRRAARFFCRCASAAAFAEKRMRRWRSRPARTRSASTPRRSSIRRSSRTLARRYGSQAVVVAIDAKRRGNDLPFRIAVASTRRRATRSNGRARRPIAGAGEILLTSIDRDGTKSGFDCELTAAVSGGGADTSDSLWRRGHLRALRGGVHNRPRRRRARSLDFSFQRTIA